ncbi:MAG: outer membrane beta-barrel protein [Bacteroidota bacterium]
MNERKILIVAFLLILPFYSFSQSKFGVGGSYIYNNSEYVLGKVIPFVDSFSILDDKNGFDVELHYKYRFNEKFAISSKVDYLRVKQKYEIVFLSLLYDKFERVFDQHYLEFAVYPNLYFSRDFAVYFGPKLIYNIKNSEVNNELNEYGLGINFNTMSIGLDIGLNYVYEMFYFDLSYSYLPNHTIGNIEILNYQSDIPVTYNATRVNFTVGLEF